MVPDKSVTMCQTCSAEFTILFRRHHCRACGKVRASMCSRQGGRSEGRRERGGRGEGGGEGGGREEGGKGGAERVG